MSDHETQGSGYDPDAHGHETQGRASRAPTCPLCGGRVAVTTAVRLVSIEKKTVPVSATLPQCLSCGEIHPTPEQAVELIDRAKALAG